MLTEAGYCHPVSVGDYSLNVYEFGNQNGRHTFVGMSGMGVVDFSVRTGRFMNAFAEENRIVTVDRAGYGLSDDVPKAYICAGWGFQTKEDVDAMLEWDRQECAFTGRKQPKSSEAMYDMDMWQKARDTELQPYLDKMGNCELVLLPGVHCIYDQRRRMWQRLSAIFLTESRNKPERAASLHR